MKAYRCDKCGQFRNGVPGVGEDYVVTVDTPTEDEAMVIFLCPECAPDVIAPLEDIAKTVAGG